MVKFRQLDSSAFHVTDDTLSWTAAQGAKGALAWRPAGPSGVWFPDRTGDRLEQKTDNLFAGTKPYGTTTPATE
jgi:hypothetical protein